MIKTTTSPWMALALICLIATLPHWAHAAESSTDVLAHAHVGETVTMPAFAFSHQKSFRKDLSLKRIRIRAPGAKTWVVDAHGQKTELNTPKARYFVSTPGKTGSRMYVMLDADGKNMRAAVFADGVVHQSQGTWDGKTYRPTAHKTERMNDNYQCDDAHHPDPVRAPVSPFDGLMKSLKREHTPDQHDVLLDAKHDHTVKHPQAKAGGQYHAVVAIDTDYQLLQKKFGGNTTQAEAYMNELFVGMNVIYKRDVDVTLVRGDTFFYTSDAGDPYNSPNGTSTFTQLGELGAYWLNNRSSINRAFVALISGKSSSQWSAGGVAWVLSSGNYCSSTGNNFQNYGHYSVSQVFTSSPSAASDIGLVAHELGHNFGSLHSHCVETSPGSGTFIDECTSGETSGGNACYSGPQSCPAANSHPWNNTRGSLMSYCHLSGSDGGSGACGIEEIFHPTIRTILDDRVQFNVSAGCFNTFNGTNNAPNFSQNTYAFSVPSNVSNGTVIGNVPATDIDGDALTYNIWYGNRNDVFAINNGQLIINNQASLNTGTAYELKLRVFDGKGGADTATITINRPPAYQYDVYTANTPTDIQPTSQYTLSVSDPDNDALSFAIIAGNSNGLFAINASTGRISIPNNSSLNVGDVHEITVRASDGRGGSDQAIFRATIVAVNSAPTFLSNDYAFTIQTSANNGTLIGSVLALDADGDSLTYSITAGNNDGAFSISNDSSLRVASQSLLTPGTRTLSVRASDGRGGSETVPVTITVQAASTSEIIFVSDFES